ncbi:MAG: trigger factor [Crocinitomicaceae bacterium]|jgi:trigger factor|nr:trigger factor [Crocinitomicaceae bacterium]
MNVIRQDVDALNAKLKVQVTPADYQDKVKKSLEKYRKTAKIPGFRPGHVPFGLIQKQYGRSVLAEELNSVVNDALYKFIGDNKIDILGNPIPAEKEEVVGNFEAPADFEFTFEIGLAPTFEIPLNAKSKFDYVKIKVDGELVDQQIDDLRRRYGKMIAEESIGERDLVLCQFVELNDDETVKEGGILHTSTVSVEFVEDAKTKKALIDKKVGDKVVVDPYKVSRGGKDTAAMLGVKEEELENISKKFQLTINEIKRMELAELNQELFDKLYGEGEVKTEEEMRQRISDDLGKMFVNDSDRLLTKTVYEDLIENTKIELPNDFMKRWIRLSNEKPISAEEVEEHYDAYAKNLKWQLIQGNIFKANDIKLDNAEVVEFTKGLLVSNYAQYGIPAPGDKELTESAMGVLKNRDEANRIFDMMAEQKLTDYFKNTVKLKEKEVSYEEFMKLASQN